MPTNTTQGNDKTRKTSKIIILVISAFFLLLLCAYPDNNLFTWIAAQRTIINQEKEIRNLQKEIIEMNARIEDLSSTQDSLERFAREHFHFASTGEDIYLIDE